MSSSGYSQCTTGSEVGSVFTPNYSGDAEVISANTGNGFYTKINILPDRYYTFIVVIPTQLSAGYTDYKTITNESGTVVYASGSGVLRWASGANTGIIRYYNHLNSACTTVPSNRTKLIVSSESSCLPPTSFSSNTVSSTSVNLTWQNSVSAPSDGYEYYVSSSADFPSNLSSVVPTGVTSVANAIVTIPDNTLNYHWWVRSKCGAIRSIWSKGGAFTICTEPTPVTITNLSTFSANLNWTSPSPVPDDGYQYTFSTTNSLPAASLFSNTISNSATLSGLLSGTVYYYWVRSNCNVDNQSNWVTGSFTTETVYCTNAPFGLYPAATYTPTCTGSEEAIVTDAYFGEYSKVNIQPNTIYTLTTSLIKDNGVFTSGYVTVTNEDGTINYAGGLAPIIWNSGINSGVIRYYLHKNAFCFTSNNSVEKYITCSQTLSNTVIGFDDYDLKLFPNPIKNTLNVSSENVISKISIYDIVGQKVISKAINATVGIIDTSSLPSGTYIVKVASNDAVQTLKVIKK